jgi:hypothetical protein
MTNTGIYGSLFTEMQTQKFNADEQKNFICNIKK